MKNKSKNIKIAIIHDVFIESGGAERVLFSLLRMYPDADLIVPLLSQKKEDELREFGVKKIYTSFFNKIPFIHSASILLKPMLYWYWESLDLNKYDLVISSSHSFSSKGVITSPNTAHVSYVHTPPRYLYAEYNETQIIKKPFFKTILQPLLSWLRVKDYVAAQRPDILIANSKIVQRRISKYYRRESELVYPPVSFVPKKISNRNKKEYFLCFSRLAKQKGIDLAIKACNKNQLPLLVIGTGSEESYLRSIAGSTVTFLGYVEDSKLSKAISKSKALIYCSREEDFGIVPVEVMAHGVPVIGYKSGGVVETVVDGKTGVLFDEYSENGLSKAIKTFDKKSFKKKDCTNRARMFDEDKFFSKMKKVVDNALKNSQKL